MKPVIEQACDVFNAKPKELQSFDVADHFNNHHRLQGWLCRIPDYRYGALYISSINNIPYKPQIIYGTPKMHYPFDKNGRFKWPPCKKIAVYTKYDGTNVLAYSYVYKGKRYVTYKTRLTPILQSGKFGDFVAMWKELLERYPGIPYLVLENGFNVSFEMFGARNKHLIIYDVPLEARLLFAIDQKTLIPKIIDPQDIHHDFVPIADGKTYDNPHDLTSFYKKHQAETEAMNKTTDFGIKGSEGYILYCHTTDGEVRQLKLKPESIEQIAWASGGPDNNSIRTTCINAFESHEDVTVDIVKELLAEEFDWRQVETKHYSIVKILKEVIEDLEFRNKVLFIYRTLGTNIVEHKRETMRTLSEYFPRNKMGYVYWIVANS